VSSCLRAPGYVEEFERQGFGDITAAARQAPTRELASLVSDDLLHGLFAVGSAAEARVAWANRKARSSMPNPLRPLTRAEIEDYHRDGVVCVRGVFDETWLPRMATAVERVAATPTPFGRAQNQPDNGFANDLFMWQSDDDFRDFVFDSPAVDYARQICSIWMPFDPVSRTSTSTCWRPTSRTRPWWRRGATSSTWWAGTWSPVMH